MDNDDNHIVTLLNCEAIHSTFDTTESPEDKAMFMFVEWMHNRWIKMVDEYMLIN